MLARYRLKYLLTSLLVFVWEGGGEGFEMLWFVLVGCRLCFWGVLWWI